MANLVQNLSGEEETFYLDSMDLFRPELKQIGESIDEIKTHYMCNGKFKDVINIIPNNCTPRLAGVRETMLKHLENDSFFLYQYNVVTGSLINLSAEVKKRLPGLLVLMDSLALAMDLEISPRPSDVQCDILLAICGQPVIVLTLVDGDKDSETVTIYNTSVARGVTSTLRKFMDESVNVVFGVLCRSEMDTLDTFRTSIEAIAKDSSLFVTLSALETSPSRYEKIMTAFWAAVAGTRSVISRDGRVDTDYLRFLTKDQCIILVENINNREVEVHSKPGTGATTLMLEVARRLSILDKTLLVCRSQEEKNRLCTLYETTVIPDELCRIDLSSFKNVVDETGMVKQSTSGRLWTFSRAEEGHDKGNDSEQTAAMKIEPESKGIGLEPNYGTKTEDVIKVFKDIKLKPSVVLSKQSTWKEEELNLGSMDLFRPPLKQILNSICDIKTHYMSDAGISIVPFACPPRVSKVRDSLLEHLEEGSFLYKYNVVTGSFIDSSGDKKKRLPSVMVLMDSLALAMDLEISPRSSDVQCDILLVICGQPVIVLTLVDGDKDSDTVTMYNTSVARGVTTTLRKFMDESVNVVFGVLCRSDLDTLDTFQTSIEAIAKDSSLYVKLSALETSPSKYEKIVTAFWAGVAETRSVISRDGRVDTDYLRFLTKDQCIILMENINNREVEVQFQPGTGATTLMLEIARRLSKLDDTLLVCRSLDEKEILRSVHQETFVPEDLIKIDKSKYKHVVDETGIVDWGSTTRLWRFSADHFQRKMEDTEFVIREGTELTTGNLTLGMSTKGLSHHIDHLLSTTTDLEEKKEVGQFLSQKDLSNLNFLKASMASIEQELDNKEKLVSVLSSVDRQRKLDHLSGEIDTLKLYDMKTQEYRHETAIYGHTKDSQWKHDPTREEGFTETGEPQYPCMEELLKGLNARTDLFPVLKTVVTRDKEMIFILQAKIAFLKEAIEQEGEDEIGIWVAKPTKTDTGTKEVGHDTLTSAYKGDLKSPEQVSLEKTRKQTMTKTPTKPGITLGVEESSKTRTTLQEKEFGEIVEMRNKLQDLKKMSVNQDRDLAETSEGDRQEWEYKLHYLSKEIPALTIHEYITHVIGDIIPVSVDQTGDLKEIKDIPDISKRSPVHQLRQFQHGHLTNRHLTNIVREVIIKDNSTLSELRVKSAHLERVYGCPVYMVDEADSPRSGPVSCPPMTLDRERVSEELAVSGDGLELVNTRGSLDQGTDQMKRYYGTCSRQPIPLPLSPSTLTVPRYWETHSRVQVKEPVTRCWILEMAVNREGEVDWLYPSWSVDVGGCVRDCDRHRGICTRVMEGRRQVSKCLTDTMSPTPGTDVTLIYGVVLDIGRGRLAFIDVNRGRVLHKFDLDIRESLFPMLGATPFEYSQCDVAMRLVSGREIAMTDKKKSLIATALYSQ